MALTPAGLAFVRKVCVYPTSPEYIKHILITGTVKDAFRPGSERVHGNQNSIATPVSFRHGMGKLKENY